MHACLHGRRALVTGSARQTMQTAFTKSDDEGDKLLSSGDEDDDVVAWVDVL